MYCPVCETEPARHFRKCGVHDYWRCNTCAATFLDPRQLPDRATEHRRYRLHRNDPDDARYRAFLSRLATPLLARLPAGLLGLDYGCGPGPALAVMLREAGHTMAIYDPLFFNDPSALTGQYDFITCTEVMEHFHHPAKELARLNQLLTAGGWLGVMTMFLTDDDAFPQWHYRRDPTHVVFYQAATFEIIARRRGWQCEIPGPNIALLHKPGQGG